MLKGFGLIIVHVSDQGKIVGFLFFHFVSVILVLYLNYHVNYNIQLRGHGICKIEESSMFFLCQYLAILVQILLYLNETSKILLHLIDNIYVLMGVWLR
jgi:bacteriorhodopsin